MQAWNVKQIANELQQSYQACHTEFERSMWRVFATKDVKRMLGDRKPTPGESAILDQYGIVLHS